MIHGSTKCSTGCAKCSKEVLNVSPRGSNVPRSCQTFNEGCQMVRGDAKYSTEGAKCSTEVLNVPRMVPNVSHRG